MNPYEARTTKAILSAQTLSDLCTFQHAQECMDSAQKPSPCSHSCCAHDCQLHRHDPWCGPCRDPRPVARCQPHRHDPWPVMSLTCGPRPATRGCAGTSGRPTRTRCGGPPSTSPARRTASTLLTVRPLATPTLQARPAFMAVQPIMNARVHTRARVHARTHPATHPATHRAHRGQTIHRLLCATVHGLHPATIHNSSALHHRPHPRLVDARARRHDDGGRGRRPVHQARHCVRPCCPMPPPAVWPA